MIQKTCGIAATINLTTQEVFESIKDYVGKGGTIYVGTDSMLRHDYCKFASVIAIHSNDLKLQIIFLKRKTAC